MGIRVVVVPFSPKNNDFFNTTKKSATIYTRCKHKPARDSENSHNHAGPLDILVFVHRLSRPVVYYLSDAVHARIPLDYLEEHIPNIQKTGAFENASFFCGRIIKLNNLLCLSLCHG